MPQTDIRAQLGLRPIINVSGTMTFLGASIVAAAASAIIAGATHAHLARPNG